MIGVLVRSQPLPGGWRVIIPESSVSVVCGWSALAWRNRRLRLTFGFRFNR
jgi:hypothetical protein